MERIHVMHVTDSLALGGKERILTVLANQLVSDGMDVSVCVTRTDLTLAPELLSNITVGVLGRKSSIDLSGFRTFKDFVKQQKPGLFHAHGRSTLSFLAFLKTAYQISQPIVFHDHYGIEMDQAIPGWFRWWGHHLVDHYVGVYSKLADWAVVAGIPQKKISVIENAINLSPYMTSEAWDLRAQYGISRKKKIGVMVAGIREEKGLDLLIHAMRNIRHVTDAHILVVGNAHDSEYMKTCLHEISTHHLSSCFTFVGQKSEVPSILRGADFALMPSRCESGPVVLIEYLATGLPVVAFRVGAISEAAAKQAVPGIVEPEDVESFANEIDCLLEMSSKQLAQRGSYGQVIAQDKFDISVAMAKWYAVYEKVLRPKRTST
jgi:glycosyltransferase involved in cell wall biosynthesis